MIYAKYLIVLLGMSKKWYEIFKHCVWIYQHIYLLRQAILSKLMEKLSPASKPAELTAKQEIYGKQWLPKLNSPGVT